MSYTEPIEMALSRVARDCSALLGGRNSHDRDALIEDLYRMERQLHDARGVLDRCVCGHPSNFHARTDHSGGCTDGLSWKKPATCDCRAYKADVDVWEAIR